MAGPQRITEARHVDMWTALVTGLVDQQVSNDPGGDRWSRLIEESMEMFLSHCQSQRGLPTSLPSLTRRKTKPS